MKIIAETQEVGVMIENVIEYVKQIFANNCSGHDYHHMKKNFVNQLNNPDKMSPTLYLSIEDIEYEGMTLLWVYVPPTSIESL